MKRMLTFISEAVGRLRALSTEGRGWTMASAEFCTILTLQWLSLNTSQALEYAE
jgi:hypothetical protein